LRVTAVLRLADGSAYRRRTVPPKLTPSCAAAAIVLATAGQWPCTEFEIMAESKDTNEAIAEMKREIAELSGLSLATGVILTQLLQKIASREMNPQGAAGQIVNNARAAIEGFTAQQKSDPIMKARALDAVKQYEDQIRSVLRD
jgi:uncharacterized NAD(P)/FAD-binding protein YdhS